MQQDLKGQKAIGIAILGMEVAHSLLHKPDGPFPLDYLNPNEDGTHRPRQYSVEEQKDQAIWHDFEEWEVDMQDIWWSAVNNLPEGPVLDAISQAGEAFELHITDDKIANNAWWIRVHLEAIEAIENIES